MSVAPSPVAASRPVGPATSSTLSKFRLREPELSLVFPAWNEQDNLEPLVATAVALGRRLGKRFEIVIVDDGSRDASQEILDKLRRSHPELRAITHAANRGYGAALASGLRAARGELVFFSDADLQFDLSEIEHLLAHTDEFDVVAGYRSPRRDPLVRRVLAIGWGGLVQRVFGLEVRDIDCAFKLFRRDVIDTIPIASLGAFVNTEILVRAQASGFRIHQVPVTHHPRRFGEQSGAKPRVIARALLELVQLRRDLRSR